MPKNQNSVFRLKPKNAEKGKEAHNYISEPIFLDFTPIFSKFGFLVHDFVNYGIFSKIFKKI